MALESATHISDLVVSNPAATDQVSQADDHLRLIKTVLKTTFPNANSPITATPADLNGVSALASRLTAVEEGKLSLTGGSMTGAIAMGNNKITGLAVPTATSDAARKADVDAVSAAKAGVDVSITGSGSITGGGTLAASRTLSLSGDSAAPGASRYYGTNSGGAKGFHAFPEQANKVYAGADSNNTEFPVGTYVVAWVDGVPNRNQHITTLRTAHPSYPYMFDSRAAYASSGVAINGTWAVRGITGAVNEVNAFLLQRVA